MRTRARSWFVLVLLGVVSCTAIPCTAAAQAPPEDVWRELADLRRELDRLRAEVESLKAGTVVQGSPAAATAPASIQAPALPPPVHGEHAGEQIAETASSQVLAAQVAELAQVKVESASRMPVRIFGTLHASAFANSGEANWLDSPNLVPAPPPDGRKGSFSMGLRQTRLGLTMDGPTLGAARTSGTIVADFFGGIPGFQTGQVMGLPRLLVAYARVETSRTALEIGQDHVVLAPRDPTSLAAFAFPSLFRSGNLYLRAPQARVEGALTPQLRVTGAIVAPIGGDLAGEDYRFVPPVLGGERSRRPALEGRVAFDSTTDRDAPGLVSLGISGHYGTERRGANDAVASAIAGDFALRRNWIGAAGEIFTGRNVDAFGGGTGLDARATGGWAELQLFASPRLTFHGGAGIDDLRGEQTAALPRRRNRSAYGNVIVSLTPEVQASFEYRWLATAPGAGPERRNHHFNWALAYKF